MRRGHGTLYVLGFAAGICLVCSLAISSLALGLKPLKEKNVEIDKKKNVLAAAGLVVDKEKVIETFEQKVVAKVVDLKAGKLESSAKKCVASRRRRRRRARASSRSRLLATNRAP